MTDHDLKHLAYEELEAACRMSWRELQKVVPWGDSFRGFAPDGREVEIERSYIWSGDGEAILCEVVVRCVPERENCGAEVWRLITPETAAN